MEKKIYPLLKVEDFKGTLDHIMASVKPAFDQPGIKLPPVVIVVRDEIMRDLVRQISNDNNVSFSNPEYYPSSDFQYMHGPHQIRIVSKALYKEILDVEIPKTNQYIPRKAVLWFAGEMENKLKENDHKGGWGKCSLQYLSMRLTQERKELTTAFQNNDAAAITKECADIANFAMMIADQFNHNYGK